MPSCKIFIVFGVSLFMLLQCICAIAIAQRKDDDLLESLLIGSNDTAITKVMADPSAYRLQVIYTQVDRDRKNRPLFRNFNFRYDPAEYFNPASMVKLPLAILALEKLNRMNAAGVTKNTQVQFDSSYYGQVAVRNDSTAATGKPSIAHYIKKAFLISDNDAYNRLYQFVGQRTIDTALKNKGYSDTRILRQFMGFSEDQNRHTNQVIFLDNAGKQIFRQEAAYNTDSFSFPGPVKIGKGYINREGNLVNEPFDFTRQNNVSLETLRLMLQAIIFPESLPAPRRFQLSADDRKFLLKFLSQYPSETSDPKYDVATFYDSYVKFFFRDSTHRMPPGLRLFNKVGWSYGFLTDVSYVVDFNNQLEFMLAATLYVNSDSILNDNRYDYDSIGYPFLRAVGQTIYQYELGRKRRHRPDLSNLRILYDTRDPNDQRPTIRIADN